MGLFRGQHEIERFESELKDYFGVSDCFLFSSGKAALAFSLMTLKEMHPERNEVVMPAYICYSVPSAVVRAGLKVVPCDMAPNTLEMDLDQLYSLLRETTLCVIVPHLFGYPAELSEIMGLCHEKGVVVIEDAAQTIGTEYKGEMLGTQADIGFFSLGRGKTISTVEGGILITKHASLAKLFWANFATSETYSLREKLILLLKAFLIYLFSRPSLYWFPKLFPFLKLGDTIFDPHFPLKKLSGVQAGFAGNWNKKAEDFNSQRKRNAKRLFETLSTNNSFSLFTKNGFSPRCLRLPIFIEETETKEQILAESEKNGLGVMFTYPDSIEGIPELAHILSPCNYQKQPKQLNKPDKPNKLKQLNKPKYPQAKRMAEHMLTLPVHPFVSKHDIQKIIGLFNHI